jgi:hypothetical protein
MKRHIGSMTNHKFREPGTSTKTHDKCQQTRESAILMKFCESDSRSDHNITHPCKTQLQFAKCNGAGSSGKLIYGQ